MPVRADTLKTDPVVHQEVFALFIAKPLELLTVIHCMGLHLVIEAVCTRVRWSSVAWLLRGWKVAWWSGSQAWLLSLDCCHLRFFVNKV